MEQYLPSGQFYSAGDRMWPVPYFVFPDFTISQWTCFTKSFSKTKRFYSKHQEESGVKQASYLSTPLPPTCQLISSIVFKKWTLSEFPGGLVLLPLLLGLLLWHMFHPWPGELIYICRGCRQKNKLVKITQEAVSTVLKAWTLEPLWPGFKSASVPC